MTGYHISLQENVIVLHILIAWQCGRHLTIRATIVIEDLSDYKIILTVVPPGC